MKTKLNCAVIGAGIAGASAAYALLKRGARVTLFDQFPLFHERGSSHGPTRLFRIAYFEHADYVPILQDAAKKWRALGKEAGEPLLNQCGVIMMGGPESALVSGVRHAAKEYGVGINELTRTDAQNRFPYLRQPKGYDAILEPDAGLILSERAMRHLLNEILAMGGNVKPETKVIDWEASSQSIIVTTTQSCEHFDRLVIAPGAWGNSLLKLDAVPVQPLRKSLFWIAAGQAAYFLEHGFLPFAAEREDGRFFYGFPAIDEEGVKIGEHTGGTALSSPSDEAPPPTDEATSLKAFLSEFLPKAPRNFSTIRQCLYEKSSDGHFLIDRHKDDDRVCFAAGLSGHGFKFGPVIGEALADFAFTGETKKEFGFLSTSRFQGKRTR